MEIDFVLRILTFASFFIWRAYWFFGKKKAEKLKRKLDKKPRILEMIFILLLGLLVLINLLGFIIFTFENIYIQSFGFILVILGIFESILGRKILDANWTEAYDYQIKENHELVLNGIYKFVRHPIYGGMLLSVTGALMVSQSYLFIPTLVITYLVFDYFAKREEALLTKHFGKEYLDYMKTTKKFLPFLY